MKPKQNEEKTDNRLMEKLPKILMVASVLYVAMAPFAYVWSTELASRMLLSGILLAVLSRFSDLTEVGLLGILTAKLKRALDQSHATLEQLRALAKISAMSSLSNTARSGWVGGITDEHSAEILHSTKHVLEGLGCGPDEISVCTLDYHHCLLSDFRQVLLGGGPSEEPNLNAGLLEKADEVACRREWHNLRDRPVAPPVSPDELYSFFEKYGFLNAENKNRLADYKHYYEHHEFRDFADFKNRQHWPRLEVVEKPAADSQ